MIPNLTAIILLIVATPMLILAVFLPTIIELKKPKDKGPRVIMAEIPQVQTPMPRIIPKLNIISVEEEQAFDHSLIQSIAQVIEVLPSLEV
ncbi:MAG: hypothetical protein NWE99_05085 [Candidatus Bathyarchaeota archaeon]|nr:hypothetical protein [Candidatus Bathyarchaeota archaeon]